MGVLSSNRIGGVDDLPVGQEGRYRVGLVVGVAVFHHDEVAGGPEGRDWFESRSGGCSESVCRAICNSCRVGHGVENRPGVVAAS